jgi:hypothetical protein
MPSVWLNRTVKPRPPSSAQPTHEIRSLLELGQLLTRLGVPAAPAKKGPQ